MMWRLILRNLSHYWRTHIGLVLGVAVSTSVLTGALLTGDSVRYSLESMMYSRLGDIHLALDGNNRFFRTKLADELAVAMDAPIAPVLKLKGLLIHQDSGKRVSNIQVLGVDDRFWQLGKTKNPLGTGDEEIVLNEALAKKLNVKTGDSILLRVEKPHLLSLEAPLSQDKDISTARPVTVKAVISDQEFGGFSLLPNQRKSLNAFISLQRLENMVEMPGQSNLLLTGAGRTKAVNSAGAEQALQQCFTLADVSLSLRELPDVNQLELKSSRIFLDQEIGSAAMQASTGAIGLLSYFVNSLESSQYKTPYSIVTAIGMLPPGTGNIPAILPDMHPDEITINEWLANDLHVKTGEPIKLSYYVMGAGRKLEVKETSFKVKSILPMEGFAIDQSLMPEYPGFSEKKTCREWDPGVEINLTKIRPQDEAYWDSYKGAPKAFIPLQTGQAIWPNRFGELTAVRWLLAPGIKQKIEQNLRNNLKLSTLGLSFYPVRDQGVAASKEAMDFGSLFLGLSFFLIMAAMVLIGLLFGLSMEQRTKDAGILLALGYTWKMVKKILFIEGIIAASAGAFLGLLASIVYTRLMIFCLGTLWRGAVAGTPIFYHGNGGTLFIGWGVSVCMAAVVMRLVLRHLSKKEIRHLLDDTGDLEPFRQRKNRYGILPAIALAVLALLIPLIPVMKGNGSGAEIFFISGMLLLISGFILSHAILFRRAESVHQGSFSLGALALLNASRKRGRSLGIVIVLASASFLIIAVGANVRNPMEKSDLPESGTGGFAFIAESTMPILYDLNTINGQKSLGLDEKIMSNAGIVQLRLREGADASCLNLNRVQTPQLVGVSPDALQTRKSFSFVQMIDNRTENPWALLKEKLPDGRIPAIADQATILWGLNKKIGDTLEYISEQGQHFEFQLVGALKDSIFQGKLLIAEDRFMEFYPSEQGYRMLLINVPKEHRNTVSGALERAGRNIGLELTPAPERLAEFYMVEKTYLSIFQILGGLGLILGCAGLAFIVLRNVMERRAELALLQVVGFTNSTLYRLLFVEHLWLFVMGMACGTIAALVAVIPAFNALGSSFPWLSLGLTLTAILGSGFCWIRIAAMFAIRGSFLSALRNE